MCAGDVNRALIKASCNCTHFPPHTAEKQLTCVVCTKSGVGTLEISGGIYNTAGFLQRDSWRKDISLL